MDAFLSDQIRLTAVDSLGPLNGRITTGKDGRRQFTLYAGAHATDFGDPDRRPAWTADLHFKSAEPAATTTYWDYLNRRTASVMAGRARKAANATLVATLADQSVRPFLAHVLSTPEAFVGIWFFEVSDKIPARHKLPLQKTAEGSSAFELRMQRRAAAAEGPDLEAMLVANHALLPRLQAVGGKIYPPSCPILSTEQWQVHYGLETWSRFATAKKQFDPNHVLTRLEFSELPLCGRSPVVKRKQSADTANEAPLRFQADTAGVMFTSASVQWHFSNLGRCPT
jgi:cytokinin dehydrogenase